MEWLKNFLAENAAIIFSSLSGIVTVLVTVCVTVWQERRKDKYTEYQREIMERQLSCYMQIASILIPKEEKKLQIIELKNFLQSDNICKKEDKSLEEICRLYRFPDKAVKLLQEYNYKSEFIVMKETAVVYLADAVLSSIMYLLEKDENKEVDFVQLATAVLKRKIDSGVLNHSNISVSELCGMEKLFTGEKLYYDFLRRE